MVIYGVAGHVATIIIVDDCPSLYAAVIAAERLSKDYDEMNRP